MATETTTTPAGEALPRGLPPGVARANQASTRLERWIALVVILTPLLGLIAAIVLLWPWGFGMTELVLLVVMYTIGGVGIGIGYHRLASHRAFQTTTPLRVLFTIAGSIAGQGPVIYWAAIHRRHHQYSDQPGDPHSPNMHGPGLWGQLKGFWHAHTGWMFVHEITDWMRWTPDLLRDRAVFRVNELYFLWVFLGLAAPAAVGGLVYALAGESPWWVGALLGFLWGGLVRMCLMHHTTWAINSVTHMWGTRPYRSRDFSRNNALVAMVTFGEGWHNNHHAFPNSAYHGLEWWQLDTNNMVIHALKACGLAWDVKCPTPEARLAARRGKDEDAAPPAPASGVAQP